MAYLLQQLLTASAARYPDKTAVVCRGEQLTYRKLDEASNRLAHLLRQRGVQRGDRVALHFGKSVRSLVSMFGVLKAGAAYVPIDPHAPAARVVQVLADCGARALITSAAKAKALGPDALGSTAVGFLLLTDSAADVTVGARPALPWSILDVFSQSAVPLDNLVESDLAYILYTSGSTGMPKGVMLTHRNALTFIDWCAEMFGIRADDRLSNHAPLHFDLSVFDIYNAIGAGATVHMIDEELVVFPASVAAFMEKAGISVWYSVPSALVQLLLHGNLAARSLARLRVVLYAGEPFPVKHLRTLCDALPHVAIYNLYGPTETNVCTYYRVPSPLPAGISHVPIGRPCENTEALALNERGEPIATGEEGELFVRGPSVTPGYWGDEEKSSRVVLHNSRQPHLGDRVYRTGDIVRLDEDGNFLFLGRRDHMIKSRGYRIELGEIEAALYAHPAVVEAAAVAVPDQEIGNRIRAYVVVKASAAVSGSDLTRHCSERIPRYMLPERVDVCELLPKTSTGKIDRQRLTTDVIG